MVQSVSATKEAAPGTPEDDELEDAPPPSRSRPPRRGAVSAEVYNEEDAKNYEKVVIPKDDATRARLEQAISTNVLFRYIDDQEKK